MDYPPDDRGFCFVGICATVERLFKLKDILAMTPESQQKLLALIKVGESYKRFPYLDTTGNLTVGYGRNLHTVGVSEPEAIDMAKNDLRFHAAECAKNLSFFLDLDDIRQMVLIIMSYNLGHKNFLNFEKMIEAIHHKDYNRAAEEMIDSVWYEQIGHRADVLVHMMRTGEL